MPQIRIMNWNIRTFSANKIIVGGGMMLTNLAQVIAAANVDVLIVVEVRMTQVARVMAALSRALNRADPAPAPNNNWKEYFISRLTGGEYYGFLIRDLNLIRPVVPQNLIGPRGTAADPLVNLQENVFVVWPTADWALSAYTVPNPPGQSNSIPLVDIFATDPVERAAKRGRFPGQAVGNGGYSLGRGSRLPAMPIFWIHTFGGDYMVPAVVCHYAAVRGGNQRNHLAQGQVGQLKLLAIPQMFLTNDPRAGGVSNYIAVVDAMGARQLQAIQEIAFTGDFNLNFLENMPGPAATNIQRTNYAAYSELTPTQEQAGSAGPAAPPGQPLAPPPGLNQAPAQPFTPPMGAEAIDEIIAQTLRAAVTTQGTILGQEASPPGPVVRAAFDNFIYGGTELNSARPPLGGIDSGQVIDVPRMIQLGQLDVSAVAAEFTLAKRWSAREAPNLQRPGALLSVNDSRIGANFLSDHLPVVLEFTCP